MIAVDRLENSNGEEVIYEEALHQEPDGAMR
jgi:hypothetical protein